MNQPFNRRNILFVTLHDSPSWLASQLEPEDTISATITLFEMTKSVTYSAEEFNTYRATYVLMGLDDPVKWAAFMSQLLFPSEQALKPPSFFL